MAAGECSDKFGYQKKIIYETIFDICDTLNNVLLYIYMKFGSFYDFWF